MLKRLRCIRTVRKYIFYKRSSEFYVNHVTSNYTYIFLPQIKCLNDWRENQVLSDTHLLYNLKLWNYTCEYLWHSKLLAISLACKNVTLTWPDHILTQRHFIEFLVSRITNRPPQSPHFPLLLWSVYPLAAGSFRREAGPACKCRKVVYNTWLTLQEGYYCV